MQAFVLGIWPTTVVLGSNSLVPTGGHTQQQPHTGNVLGNEWVVGQYLVHVPHVEHHQLAVRGGPHRGQPRRAKQEAQLEEGDSKLAMEYT